MTDKVQKIREEVEKIQLYTLQEIREEVERIQLYTQSEVLKQVLDYIDEVQKEPVSEDLEEASKEWLKPQLDKSYANYGEGKMMELTHFDGYAMLDAIEFGANWQKQQDQSTIELAEDHAMLAGMEKMKEEMMAKAIDGVVTFDYYGDDDKSYGCIAHDSFCLEDFGLKDRDKVKVIVIKED